MFPDAPLQHRAKLVVLTTFAQDAGNLRNHAPVTLLHQIQATVCPARTERGRQRLQDSFFGLFELLVRFYDLLERCDLFFWLSRLVESVEQFVSVRHALAANLNWIGLFRRDGKSAACLKGFLR